VFNLRGATRGTNRELELKEGENVFNIMTGVAIFLLIKTESAPNALGKLHYYDIGDSLSRDEKLAKIKDFSSIENIPWEIITPNAAGDWINQRGVTFNEFIPLENKIFNIHSIGVKSCCYALTYNSSRPAIERNVRMIIDAPNKDREKCADECEIFSEKKVCTFDRNAYRQSVYRPFHKQWLYFSPSFIQCTQKQSFIFPISERKNVAITCTGDAKRKGFSVLVINFIPDCQMNHGGKCFPLYFYEEQGTCGLIQSELL
jgi:predicted helicase